MSSPFRRLLARSALFSLGLTGFALAGLIMAPLAARLGKRGKRPAALLSAVAGRFAAALFPGVISLPHFDDCFYLVDSISYPKRVQAGRTFTLAVTLLNLGRRAWQGAAMDYPLRLGTWNPENHASVFQDPSWIRPDRPGGLAGPVQPGEAGAINMTFAAPAVPGRYKEELAPVADGLQWLPGDRILIDVRVTGQGSQPCQE